MFGPVRSARLLQYGGGSLRDVCPLLSSLRARLSLALDARICYKTRFRPFGNKGGGLPVCLPAGLFEQSKYMLA